MGALVRMGGALLKAHPYGRAVSAASKYGPLAYKAGKFARSALLSRKRKRGASSFGADGAPQNATSTYKQFSVAYRRKKPTKRVKRGLRFVKRVQWAQSKSRGLGTLSKMDRTVAGPSQPNECTWTPIGTLYGMNSGSTFPGWDDLVSLRGVIVGTSSPGVKERFRVNKVSVEIFIRNTGDSTAFCDLYEWVLRKDVQASLGLHEIQMLNNLQATTVVNTGGTENLNSLLYSPFDVSEFCKRFLIVKIQRIQLPPGDSTSLTRTFGRSVVSSVNDLLPAAGIAGRAFKTRGWFMRCAGEMTPTLNASISSCTVLFKRTYTWNKMPDTLNEQGYIATPTNP